MFRIQNVEKALLRHTQEALEDKHVAALADPYTNLIIADIPQTLDYLSMTLARHQLRK